MMTTRTLLMTLSVFSLVAAPMSADARSLATDEYEDSSRVRRSQPSDAVRPLPKGSVVTAAAMSQVGIGYGPTAVGIAGEYQTQLTARLRLALGLAFAMRENRHTVQPHAGVELALTRFGDFGIHIGGGLATPVQFMAGTEAISAAVRGVIGTRWKVHDRFLPQAEVVVLTGGMLSPGNVRSKFYGAVQLMLGVGFAI